MELIVPVEARRSWAVVEGAMLDSLQTLGVPGREGFVLVTIWDNAVEQADVLSRAHNGVGPGFSKMEVDVGRMWRIERVAKERAGEGQEAWMPWAMWTLEDVCGLQNPLFP